MIESEESQDFDKEIKTPLNELLNLLVKENYEPNSYISDDIVSKIYNLQYLKYYNGGDQIIKSQIIPTFLYLDRDEYKTLNIEEDVKYLLKNLTIDHFPDFLYNLNDNKEIKKIFNDKIKTPLDKLLNLLVKENYEPNSYISNDIVFKIYNLKDLKYYNGDNQIIKSQIIPTLLNLNCNEYKISNIKEDVEYLLKNLTSDDFSKFLYNLNDNEEMINEEMINLIHSNNPYGGLF